MKHSPIFFAFIFSIALVFFFSLVPHAAFAALTFQPASGPWSPGTPSYWDAGNTIANTNPPYPASSFYLPNSGASYSSTYPYQCGQDSSNFTTCVGNYPGYTDRYVCPPAGATQLATLAYVFSGCTLDNSGPNAVTISTSFVTANSINISWLATTDVGGAGMGGYRVLYWQNGSPFPYIQILDIPDTGAASYSVTDGPTPIGTATIASGRTLPSSTTYSYQVAAYDKLMNLSSSNIASATTLAGNPPGVTTSAAAPSTTSAALYGSVYPYGSPTMGWFRYSTTNPGSCNNTFGTATTPQSLGQSTSTTIPTPLLGSASPLIPGTNYWYCAIAQNSWGFGYGNVIPFTTVALITYNIQVTIAGTGTGTISFNPNSGIPCGTNCMSYVSGTSVALNAIPTTGNFTGWSAGTGSATVCTGAGSCSFSITADSTVTATFDLMPPTVITNFPPTSITTSSATISGSVNPNGNTSSSAGSYWFRYGTSNVACGSLAAATVSTGFPSGTTAVSYPQSITGLFPNTTYYFCIIASNGGGISFGSVLSFVTSATLYTLTVTPAGTGAGTVAVNPPTGPYTSGTSVTLTATPSGSSTFAGFSGSCVSAFSTCTFTITGNASVTATFSLPGDQPPIALFSVAPTSGFAPLTVSVDASASSDPNDPGGPGTIIEYIWSWGDGSATTSTSALNTHTYATAGTYTLALTVVDNGNLSTASGAASQTITASAAPLPVVAMICTAACTTDNDCVSPNICGPAGVCINPAGAGGGPLRFDGAFASVDGSNFQYAPAQFNANTASLYMSVRTDVNSTCQYVLNTPNTFYGAQTMKQFTKTGGLTHSVKIAGLKPGGTLTAPLSQTYDYYVKCKDTKGDFNTSDYPVSVTISAVNMITPPGNYLCLINQSFVKNNIPYFYDICMRQCTVDADCQTTQTPTSTCDVAKKVCK